jgi:hypothetical protein
MAFDESPSLGCRGCLISALGIAFVILFCGGGLLTFYDVRCTQDASQWIPIYPDSTVISQQYNFARPFGVGVTLTRLHSDDDKAAVQSFYVETQRALRQADIEPLEARMSYFVETDPAGGTTIDLLSQCVVAGMG